MNDAVVITGATGLVGRRLTTDLLSEGYQVFAVGRPTSADLDAAKIGGAVVLGLDLATESAASELCEELEGRDFDALHLINAAREVGNLRVAGAGYPSREQWGSEFSLGVIAPFELASVLSDAFADRLVSIVNIGSIYGMVAARPSLYDIPETQSPIHYGVVKAALLHLTKELAVRLAPKGTRVNAVSYGGVKGRAAPDLVARYAQQTPQGRMLSEDDLTGAVKFLLSSSASGVTGHNLVVDGGWTVW